MTPFRPTGRTIWRLKVPNAAGGWADRSTGTRDRITAKAMERMVQSLGPRGARAWDLLDRVHAGTLPLGQLYDAWAANDLDGLRARLVDLDLRPVVDRWQQWLVGRVSAAGRIEYRRNLLTLAPADAPWLRSTVTPATVEAWLSALPVSGPTKRKYYAAVQSFFGYARRVAHVLPADPMADLSPPPAGAPRVEYLDLPDVRRVVDGEAEPLRSLFACLYGTGLDLSTALGLRRRDVDLPARTIRGRGTKEHTRDRVVVLAEWAVDAVTIALAGKLPDAPLWPGVTRYAASKAHRAALKRLDLPALRLHDARHHWAVRMLRAGTPAEVVARQLGHVDAVLVLRVYGRFVPTPAEQAHWAAEAERADARRGAK